MPKSGGRKWPTIRRDTVIWLMGIGLTLNEFLVEPKPRPEALVFCGMLLGLPGVLAAKEYATRVLDAAESKEEVE